jgi:hypothetical protein
LSAQCCPRETPPAAFARCVRLAIAPHVPRLRKMLCVVPVLRACEEPRECGERHTGAELSQRKVKSHHERRGCVLKSGWDVYRAKRKTTKINLNLTKIDRMSNETEA